MKVLELKNVYKDYKLANKEKFRALDKINISFDKGELVSIVGESGSGKSTLMNIIGGLDSDYEGEIYINGKDLKGFKEKQLDDYRKKNIGFVFQSFNLIPHLSVLDNVTIPLTLTNEKDEIKNKKAMALLEKLGLKDHAKKRPNQLSGGQKQRVAIARALINDPDIILADEPTGALDSSTTLQILDILKEIADEGKLVIMVTHSEKVAKISSRVVEIADGKVVKDKTNPKYQKSTKHEITISSNSNKIDSKQKKEGHLSFFSALKHSIHSMLASKAKNILMAVGVSISLIAMILMLSLGAGLTGYIGDLAEDYSNPTYVTLSKSGKDRDGNEVAGSTDPTKMFVPKTFSEDDVNEIVLDLNNKLTDADKSFQVVKDGENANLSYGFSMMSMTAGQIIYDPETGNDEDISKNAIMYTYTTPPYYGEHNLLSSEGHLPGEQEILLSGACLKLFGVQDYNEVIGKEVTLNINFALGEDNYIISKKVTVSGVVDVSLFNEYLVMYIDYNYFNNCIKEAQALSGKEQTGISPSLIFIHTDSEKTTDFLNSYIKEHRRDLSGSVEEQMVAMFQEMMSTFSIALAIISGISLFVALIMILVVLYMSVSERTREIGVLKSIGARRKDIRKIFTTESLLIGLFSGLFGCALAGIFGLILKIILKAVLGFAPIAMLGQYFLIALGISVFISVLAGLYPASKASKLDPVDALRHE